jgi:hypothetical protein
MVGTVEERFSRYSGTESVSRTTNLGKFFHQCAAFKRRLERLEHTYSFKLSGPGTAFVPETMQSFNADEIPSSVVELSLWPSLWKGIGEHSQLIEPELVWTVSSATPSNAHNSHDDPVRSDGPGHSIKEACDDHRSPPAQDDTGCAGEERDHAEHPEEDYYMHEEGADLIQFD